MSRRLCVANVQSPVSLHIDYAAEAEPAQHAAVTAAGGAVVVIAGAVVGQDATNEPIRVGFLLERQFPADRILFDHVFTKQAGQGNDAAAVSDLLGDARGSVAVGRDVSRDRHIESLRAHADLLGFITRLHPHGSRGTQKDLINACLARGGRLTCRRLAFPRPKFCRTFFLAVKQEQGPSGNDRGKCMIYSARSRRRSRHPGALRPRGGGERGHEHAMDFDAFWNCA